MAEKGKSDKNILASNTEINLFTTINLVFISKTIEFIQVYHLMHNQYHYLLPYSMLSSCLKYHSQNSYDKNSILLYLFSNQNLFNLMHI